MNNLKHIAPFLLAVIVLAACKKDKETTPEPVVTPPAALQSDHGKVTIAYGSHTLVTEGACTIENVAGHPTITIQDATNAGRTFTVGLTDNVVPIVSATYTLTGETGQQPLPGTAFAYFQDNMTGYWSSRMDSGTITFTVTGNEAVCTMTNVPLYPHPNVNQGDAATVATVSGTFKFDVQ